MDRDKENRGSVIYISHGGGPMPLLGDKSHEKMVDFLQELPSVLKKPDEILVVSAHWEEAKPAVIGSDVPGLYYDYYGFPEKSYNISYPVKGDKNLVDAIQQQLADHGIESSVDYERGIDHGVFIPLILMYPDADIPVTQLSLIKGLDPGEHLRLGEALRPLLERNILIIGSGFSFHNMSMFSTNMKNNEDELNNNFQDWLIDVCANTEDLNRRTGILEKWEDAPGARYCHPREEHLLPLHICAALAGTSADVIFDDYIMGKRAVAFKW